MISRFDIKDDGDESEERSFHPGGFSISEALLEITVAKFRLGRFQTERGFRIGPGDVPKNALLLIRRDVAAFVKKNEELVRRSTVGNQNKYVPILDFDGWTVVGYDFWVVRNENLGLRHLSFRELGWHPDDITERLDEAAWAFPKTELYVGDPERGDRTIVGRGEEPGQLYFWTEKK